MARITYKDFLYTGPGTLAGRYLRRFWQPVVAAEDVTPGRAMPVRIMSEDFTLYRGEDGTPHLVGFRCAHRGTQLSVGWVEGDCIRCFYHGWKYDASGQCIEQPAEPEPFAQKVRIPSYPVKEYIGLIFAYLGEGDPPPLPRYSTFEDPTCVLDVETHYRPYNYFSNIENAVDTSHVGFVHRRHREYVGGYEDTGIPDISAEESEWGITTRARFPTGVESISNFGMPNINYVYAQSIDPEVRRAEMLIFKVPVSDTEHVHFNVRKYRVQGEEAERLLARRRVQKARERAEGGGALIQAILAGKLSLDDIDRGQIGFILLEDGVAQGGQGVIWEGKGEHLGRGDVGVILLRKLWARELRALAEGRPLKQWAYRDQLVATKRR